MSVFLISCLYDGSLVGLVTNWLFPLFPQVSHTGCSLTDMETWYQVSDLTLQKRYMHFTLDIAYTFGLVFWVKSPLDGTF